MSNERRMIFQGRVVQLSVESVRLPNGELARFEIVHHPGGAAIVALDNRDQVCLLRQYRHAIGGWLWELPAGKLDGGEDPLHCAQRELQEEAGCQATQWQSLGAVISSPGVFTEQVHLFLARELSVVESAVEAHEVFEVHWRPFSDVLAMAQDGEITDAKTIAGLVRAARSVGGNVE